MGFNVIIKNQEKENKVVENCENGDTVLELKQKYAAMGVDMLVDNMRFVCGGNECENNQSLADAGIQEGTPVMVVYQVIGGN